MRPVLACLAAVPLLLSVPSHADTTYSYQGAPFSLAYSPYTTTDAIAGTFTVQGTLAPGLNGSVLTTLSAFSFNDGVETFSNNADTTYYFAPYTDAQDDLTSFFLEMVTYLPNSTSSDLYFNEGVILYGPAYAGMVQTIASEDRANQVSGFAQTLTGGTLTSTAVSTTPEPSSIALLLTGALGLVGIRRKRVR